MEENRNLYEQRGNIPNYFRKFSNTWRKISNILRALWGILHARLSAPAAVRAAQNRKITNKMAAAGIKKHKESRGKRRKSANLSAAAPRTAEADLSTVPKMSARLFAGLIFVPPHALIEP